MLDLLNWLLDQVKKEIDETGATYRLVQMREVIEGYLMEHKEI